MPTSDTGGFALRTRAAEAGTAIGEGLTVAVAGGQVSLATSGSTLLTEPLAATGCEYRVHADGAGMRSSATAGES